MNENSNIKMELDAHLQKKLNAYGIAPTRNQGFARHSREKFIAELNMVFDKTLPVPMAARPDFAAIVVNLRRSILYTLTTLSVLAIFLFGGAGITAYAASSSLPGDTLYSLKITSETVQANLTADPDTQARLYLTFAGRRLSEAQTLLGKGRYTDIVQATSEFESDIQKTLKAAKDLSLTDPARTIILNEEIDSVLRNYTITLKQLMATAPGEVQPVILHAINTSQSALGDDDDDETDDDNNNSILAPTITPIVTITSTSAGVVTATATPTPDSTPLPSSTPGRIINDDGNDDDGGSDGGNGDYDDDDDDNDDDDDDD